MTLLAFAGLYIFPFKWLYPILNACTCVRSRTAKMTKNDDDDDEKKVGEEEDKKTYQAFAAVHHDARYIAPGIHTALEHAPVEVRALLDELQKPASEQNRDRASAYTVHVDRTEDAKEDAE